MQNGEYNSQDRVSELFIQALEVPSTQWKNWVDTNCTQQDKQAGIDTLILKLLRSSGRADAFFDALNRNIESDLENPQNEILYKEGDVFDKFRIIKQLGQGGMATVFLCERIDGQFDQKVALKVMKVQRELFFLKEKFHQEQQILAGFNHPNIAHLYDGGISKEGFPYMIMEYVEGEPIDKYCERKKPGLRERLKLFLQVCDALQYAHNNLIVHHDIKPANILVNQAGHVKLLDFGISHIIHEQEKSTSDNTTFAGTLQYASPEQFKGSGPTVASDIFKLGLVLFKLLTGENYRTAGINYYDEGFDSRYHELKQYFRNNSLLKKQTDLVLTDLSAVIYKTLHESPDLRFFTVNSLSHDINNLLDNKPLHSHPSNWKYHIRKNISRNKRRFVFLGVFNVLLLTAIGFFIQQYFKTVQENQRAEQILGFIHEIFDSVDPVQADGQVISAIDLFDKSTERIQMLEGQPFLQSELFLITGSLISKLGDWNLSLDFYQKALEYLPEKNKSSYRLQRAKVLQHLSAGYMNTSDYVAADSLIDLALVFFERSGNAGKIYLPEVWAEKGNLLRYMSNYDEALGIIQKSIDIYRSDKRYSRHKLAKALNSKASCLREMEELEQALEAQAEALEIVSALGDNYAELYLGILGNLSIIQHRLAHYEDALESSKTAYAEHERIYGNNNPKTIRALNNLGSVYHAMQDQSKTDSIFTLVYERFEELLGPTHQYTVSSLFNLATSLYRQSKFEKVLPLYYKVLEADIATLGSDHHLVGSDYVQLGNVYMGLENWVQSEKYLRKGITIYRKHFGDSHANISRLYYFLGQMYGRKGDAEKSLDYLGRSVAMAIEHLGEENHNTKLYKKGLANFEEKFSQMSL